MKKQLTITMSKKAIVAASAGMLSLFIVGCASNGAQHRPSVVGGDLVNYERDLKQCQAKATQLDSNDTEKNTAIGTAVGAVAGALADDAIAGAVIGAVVGAATGNQKAQKAKRDMVISCMQDLGYNVVADDK